MSSQESERILLMNAWGDARELQQEKLNTILKD
jgi:hypothetical protein